MNRPFGEMLTLSDANALNWGRLDIATSFDASTPMDYIGLSLDRIARGFTQQPRVVRGQSRYPGDVVDVIENPPYGNNQPAEDDGLVIDPATGKAVRVTGRFPSSSGPGPGPGSGPVSRTPATNTTAAEEFFGDASKRVGLSIVAVIIGAIALVMILK